MMPRFLCLGWYCAALVLFFAGCAAKADYTNFRQHPPRSILVLPPLNHSTAVEATYGYLSTVTQPLAELGYYVFPVAMVDQFLKENGMPTAAEMHQLPLDKISEVFGPDAVLFVTMEEYGTNYWVIQSVTTVRVKAALVDTKTGITLWEGTGVGRQGTGSVGVTGPGGLIADAVLAAVGHIIHTSLDHAHHVSRITNANLFELTDKGLLYGPYHPNYEKPE